MEGVGSTRDELDGFGVSDFDIESMVMLTQRRYAEVFASGYSRSLKTLDAM